MLPQNNSLASYVTPLIRRISEGENLSTDEVETAFDLLFEYDTEGYYWALLTLGLHTKGETIDELWGLCKSIKKLFGPTYNFRKGLDISGTGGRSIRTFNIGTTSAFVIAGGGVSVAKQGSTAVTGLTGSLDIMSNLGIDLRYWNDSKKIIDLLENIGIVIYHSFLQGGRPHTRPQYLAKMKEIGLSFISPFHIVGSVPSPIELGYRVFGCYSTRYHARLGILLSMLGYERGIVVTGEDGIDELSTTCSTNVLEFKQGKTKEYLIDPEDIGLRKTDKNSITTRTKDENMIDFLRILRGYEKGAKREIVLANAGAGFYTSGQVNSIFSGVKLAEQVVDEGLAWEKLESLVRQAGNMNALSAWMAKAELT